MDSKSKGMEICLCPSCASAFYNIPSYRIVRKDPYQTNKDFCTYCSSRLGYDFLVFRKSNVQIERSGRVGTLEQEAENEQHKRRKAKLFGLKSCVFPERGGDMQNLISRKDAAAILGISVKVLDKARLDGLIAYVQFVENGCVYFTESAIDEYIAKCTHRARSADPTSPTYRKRRA